MTPYRNSIYETMVLANVERIANKAGRNGREKREGSQSGKERSQGKCRVWTFFGCFGTVVSVISYITCVGEANRLDSGDYRFSVRCFEMRQKYWSFDSSYLVVEIKKVVSECPVVCIRRNWGTIFSWWVLRGQYLIHTDLYHKSQSVMILLHLLCWTC